MLDLGGLDDSVERGVEHGDGVRPAVDGKAEAIAGAKRSSPSPGLALMRDDLVRRSADGVIVPASALDT